METYGPEERSLKVNTVDMGNEWRELVGRLVPMHCDVVVANSGERIELIGGNVYNTVSKSIFAARNGYLDRSAGRAFIVVIENRYPTPSS